MSKIAILSFYSGVVERGVETFAYEMARRLAKYHKVTVFSGANSRSGQIYTNVRINVIAQTPKSARGILGKFYLDLQSLRILLFSIKSITRFLKGKFDILIVLNGGWQTLIFRLVSKLTGTKLIIPGAAGIGSDDAFNILARPDVFVALTSSQASWAKKLAPEIKIETIPNGVDLSRFNPKVSPQKLTLAKPIVVCTSALVPYKRVELTIKAVARAKTLSLLVIGDGEMRGSIDSLGKRLLGTSFLRITVPYDRIPHYYRAGKVFSLASKTEAFGTSYIEAMACNLPVVTTSDSSRAEIIGDAGILTDPVNIEKYAKDLKIAAQTDYHNKPYTQSLKFSWNKIAEKYSNLIDEVTKS